MIKKALSLILSILLILFTITNITYAIPIETNPIPLGPNVKDLQDSQTITGYFQDVKRLRANLITININSNSTTDELSNTSRSLDMYIESFNHIKNSLDSYSLQYKDSFSSVSLSNQISFICTTYIMSLTEQKNLINALQTNQDYSENLFYSTHLIPVYYFLTLGDQMLTYIDTYYTF